MNKKFLSALTVLSVVLGVGVAQAQSVSSPNVTKSEVAVKSKGNFHWNDGSGKDGWKHSFEAAYGLTDWMKVEAAAKLKDDEGDDLVYDATEIKATFEMTDGVKDPYIDVGLKTAYAFSGTGGPDKVEGKLLLRKDYKEWTHKANFYVEREVGDNSADGVETGVAWGTYYDMDSYGLGAEYYGDFGSTEDDDSYSEQSHRIGPVIEFGIPVAGYEIETTLGYLHGISKAADDSTIKYEFEIEF